MSILQSLSGNKGEHKLKCYLDVDIVHLFWYQVHVERTVRSGNIISADVIEDTIEND
jgi:hypothetical protein